MEVRLTEHAKERALERGASYDEVWTTLAQGRETILKRGRRVRERVFEYNGE